MTQASFAQMLGINPATLSQILTGKSNPSLGHVEAIRKGLPNLSYAWLLDGVGPMYNVTTIKSNGTEEPTLFTEDGQPNVNPAAIPFAVSEKKDPKAQQAAIYEPVPSKFEVHKQEAPERKIKEIVIYYSNNTFETLVPNG